MILITGPSYSTLKENGEVKMYDDWSQQVLIEENDSYYWSQQVLIEEEIGEAQEYWDSTDLNPLDQQDYLAEELFFDN